MDRDYIKAKEICLEELREFRYDVNDYLPDYFPDGPYLTDWTMEDALYIQRKINKVIDVVLSTCMRNHVTQELCAIKNAMEAAIKEKNIDGCKRILNDAIQNEFYAIIKCLKALK